MWGQYRADFISEVGTFFLSAAETEKPCRHYRVSTETSTDGSRLTYYALRSHHVTGCFDGVSAPADILNVSVHSGAESVGSATELP